MSTKRETQTPTFADHIANAPAERAKLLQEIQDALRVGAQGDALGEKFTARGVLHRKQRVTLGDGTVVERL
jgi:hypothetical protein